MLAPYYMQLRCLIRRRRVLESLPQQSVWDPDAGLKAY